MKAQGPLDFVSVSASVLAHLKQRYPLDLWTISRVNGDDFIVLQYTNDNPRLQHCITYNYHDTIFSRMPHTPGAKIVQDVKTVPAYCEAPMAINLNIRGGLSVPIIVQGALFGSLCGVQSKPLDDALLKIGPDVNALADQLAAALAYDFSQWEAQRASERLVAQNHLDPITQVPDWRGWDALLDAEDKRCKTYGNKGFVVSVDMANLKRINQTAGREAGDAVLRKSAQAIQSLLRTQDIVARVGSDEFGVLCIEHPHTDAANLTHCIFNKLKSLGIDCYVGHATSLPHKGLRNAWEVAEHMMYKTKKLSTFKN